MTQTTFVLCKLFFEAILFFNYGINSRGFSVCLFFNCLRSILGKENQKLYGTFNNGIRNPPCIQITERVTYPPSFVVVMPLLEHKSNDVSRVSEGEGEEGGV